jgi:hypothetical protein
MAVDLHGVVAIEANDSPAGAVCDAAQDSFGGANSHHFFAFTSDKSRPGLPEAGRTPKAPQRHQFSRWGGMCEAQQQDYRQKWSKRA